MTNGDQVILNSWKEIAVYLDRGVRTVQRWERDLSLPVHRIGKGDRRPVYATTNEVTFWLSTVGEVSHPANLKPPAEIHYLGKPAIEATRNLRLQMRTLRENLAESKLRQHRELQRLREGQLQIKSNVAHLARFFDS